MGSNYQRNFDSGQKGGDEGILHEEISSINFRVYSSQELTQLSVCHVNTPRSFDNLHHPTPGGLYDLRMGPFTDRSAGVCLTCHLRGDHCPGHLGHIELPLPVCHPLFYTNIHAMLKMTCMTCHRFRAEEHVKKLFLVQNKLLDKGLIIAAQQASEFVVLPKKSGEKKSAEKDEDAGSSDNVDIALVVSKLNNFLKDQLALAEDQFFEMTSLSSTQSIESLRKVYTKEFRGWNTRASTCIHCGAVTKSIVLSNSRFIYEGIKLTDEDVDVVGPGAKKNRKNAEREKSELNPKDIKDHLRQVWSWDPELLSFLFPMLKHTKADFPPDLFFIDVLGVPPPKTRPCQMTGEMMTLHPQSTALEKVVENVVILKQIMQVVNGLDIDSLSEDARSLIRSLKGDTLLIKMDETWRELQISVNSVLDREMNKTAATSSMGWGLKQLVERKQGLFRMHMMGKRVNFACRTVITPDPNIAIDEIGVPDVFAKNLTYRVPVTPWNVEELRDLVINGPLNHPGAICIEEEDGKRVLISPNDPISRQAMAKTLLISNDDSEVKMKFVHRHLRNGDAMLLNRQPTLHKPSIMSHRARVLKGERVMRLHYSVCKSYNADFDGDEMNAHFPQTELGRAEAYNIANVCKQYLVPKDGTPLQGLIQDHIIAGVKMTVRGRFFNRSDYQQYVYYALVDFPGSIKILPPAIIKPIPLWSGKQVISTIILNLVPDGKHGPTLESSAKIKSTEWECSAERPWMAGGSPLAKRRDKGTTMSEEEVIFRKGEFVAGVLDKNQYGATQFSLVHAFFELYGGEYSGKLQSAFSKLFTNFLHTEGFTLGVKDILVTEDANHERRMIMQETRNFGPECAANGVNLKLDVENFSEILQDRLEQYHRESRTIPKRRAEIDYAYKQRLSPANNKINSTCLPKGLIEKFPNNNLQLMVLSGAKGSTVNTMQISCLLGQIELEGKRPPLMISGKSLPSFRPYDTQPRAGGFIDGRFMTGIRPQEFFFHCMAGREGLVDTAVKTSRSGYLQRCLVKLLEGLVVNYDMTVRDSDKSIIQFQYGEDSLDVCKSQYLIANQMKFLYDNRDVIADPEMMEKVAKMTDLKQIEKSKKSCKKWMTKHNRDYRRRTSGFALFTKKQKMIPTGAGFEPDKKDQLIEQWRSLDESDRSSYNKKASKCPDPVASRFRPDSNFGSVTETIDEMIEKYIEAESEKRVLPVKGALTFDPDEFRRILRLKFQTSIVDAGEPVGVLAAQSVGEPSTQMTLNTFHFAGRGEMNVTLGIPRLREILMVASANIKTPTMTIPFLPHVDLKERERLRTSLNRVTVADVLSEVHVSERLHIRGHKRERRITVRFEFLERKAYSDLYCVTPAQILSYIEKTFISKIFMPVLSTVMKDRRVILETGSDKRPTTNNEDGEPEDGPNAEENEIERLEKQGVGEEHASSDEEELADDADATETRKKRRQMDEEAEVEMDEEEVDFLKDIDRKMDDDFGIEEENESFNNLDKSRNNLENVDQGFEDMGEEDDGREDRFERFPDEPLTNPDSSYGRRKSFALNMLAGKAGTSAVVDYNFDDEDELWCELVLAFGVNQRRIDMSNVIKKAADKAVIHEVKNIRKAVNGKIKDEYFITTDGVNVDAMFARETLLDIRRLFCNNVHDMAKYYGIEAANKTIVREIKNVFKAYGIEVNPRHLSLVADYMTFDGTYKPFNRIGIENNPSPLQQMTFETAIGFLRSATLAGKCDTLDSPSARIVVGKPCYGGTGTFKMRQQLLGNVREGENGGNKNNKTRFCLKV